MSFYLDPPNATKDDRIPLALTGDEGLIARYLSRFTDVDTPFSWVLSGEDLRKELALLEASPESRVILTMKTDKGETEHEVLALRGQSEEEHTELVLVGRTEVADPSDQRKGEWVEALALTGGTQGGRYFWTRPKMDIGAAVRQPASSLQPS